jgi:hypothetical protein
VRKICILMGGSAANRHTFFTHPLTCCKQKGGGRQQCVMVSRVDCDEVVRNLYAVDRKFIALIGKVPVACRSCPTGEADRARAYITDQPEIILCYNRMSSKQTVREALIHESVHAYDYNNKVCDFGTCAGLAYSEIRAAREGDCAGYYTFDWLRKSCIKQKALSSTACLYPEKEARQCVREVFDTAVTDTRPNTDPPR